MSSYDLLSRRLQDARCAAGRNQKDAAELLGVTAQAISNWERGRTHIDCVSLFRLLRYYGTDIHRFLESCGLGFAEAEEESDEALLLRCYRAMGGTDQHRLLRIAQLFAGEEETPDTEDGAEERVIPLFRYLAAAGCPSPQPGEDYDELRVPASSQADFASRISGDSMEPWIHDGELVYCKRSVDLRDGEVGIFYARDGMVCKQFLRDSEGNVYLFSLNRERRDADVFYPHSSGMPLVCYGKVLLDRRVPLPED